MKAFNILPLKVVTPHNPRHEWLEKNYPGFLHTIFMQGHHAGILLSHVRYPFGFRVGYNFTGQLRGAKPRLDWFWDARELRRVRNIFINSSKKNLNFFMSIYRSWEHDHRSSIREYLRAEKVSFSTLSDEALLREYRRLYWANLRQGAHAYLADSFLTAGTDDWLTDFINRHVPSSFDLATVVQILTAPTIPTYVNESEQALERLIAAVKTYAGSKHSFITYLQKNKSSVWSALTRHAQQWYWLENNYYSRVLSPKYFAAQLFDIRSRATRLRHTFIHNKRRKEALLRKIKDPWLTHVIRMAELMTHMQDYRKMSLVRFTHFLHSILQEMAKRLGVPVKYFHNVIEPEMEKVFLLRKMDKKKLTEREKKNFVISTPRGYRVFEGAQLRRYVRETDFIPKIKSLRTITGTPASSGYATGRVRLVIDAHHPGTFLKGDILVTNNTTPEFVPLMKKAGAIVTDQGGITTHAAIVSRELGIPCVIGTKIGTRVLKTGDKVNVDAHAGIVTRV